MVVEIKELDKNTKEIMNCEGWIRGAGMKEGFS
jgi:polynucleotide 5'-kinase involved in rRNA processing